MDVNDVGSGRIGPYWRRQLGLTLPGEYTAEQLRNVNAIRATRGQPPLGGPRRATPPVPAPQVPANLADFLPGRVATPTPLMPRPTVPVRMAAPLQPALRAAVQGTPEQNVRQQAAVRAAALRLLIGKLNRLMSL